MKKPIKTLIAENNKKRKLLNEENVTYYENFLTYIRSHLFKDERATEEVLLEIVDHLLLAQEEGKSAKEVFGKNPKELADDVVENLPTEPFRNIFVFGVELMITLLASFTVVIGIMDIFMGQSKTIYAGNAFLIIGAFMTLLALVIWIFMKMLKEDSFNPSKSKKFYVFTGLTFMIGSIAIALLANKMPAFGRAIELGEYGMFGVGCVLVLISFLMKKIREQR